MARIYFKVPYRLDNVSGFLIWFEDEVDGLHLNLSGRVATFRSDEDTHQYASRNGIALEPDPSALFDFDKIEQWMENPVAAPLNREEILDTWNIFKDVAKSVQELGLPFFQAEECMLSTYQKLFRWDSSQEVTAAGKHDGPTWSDEEIGEVVNLLRIGFDMIRAAIRIEG